MRVFPDFGLNFFIMSQFVLIYISVYQVVVDSGECRDSANGDGSIETCYKSSAGVFGF